MRTKRFVAWISQFGKPQLQPYTRAHVMAWPQTSSIKSEELLALANRISDSYDLKVASLAFRNTVSTVITDVDRVSIHINRCSEPSALLAPAKIISTQRIYDAGRLSEDFLLTDPGNEDTLHRSVRAFVKAGLPIGQYHAPYIRELHTPTDEYVGAIILWRDKSARPITDDTIRTLESVASFFAFALSSGIARFQAAHRDFHGAYLLLNAIAAEASLSSREKELPVLRFNGKSAPVAAQLLRISVSTVRRHMHTIRGRLRAKLPGALDAPLPFGALFTNDRLISSRGRRDTDECRRIPS